MTARRRLRTRVSVAAFDASASETGSNPGIFRLTRAGTVTQLASPLTVTFTLTGTAANGTDYANVPLTATFAAGQPTVDVDGDAVRRRACRRFGDGDPDADHRSAPFELGSPVTATVDLSDACEPAR